MQVLALRQPAALMNTAEKIRMGQHLARVQVNHLNDTVKKKSPCGFAQVAVGREIARCRAERVNGDVASGSLAIRVHVADAELCGRWRRHGHGQAVGRHVNVVFLPVPWPQQLQQRNNRPDHLIHAPHTAPKSFTNRNLFITAPTALRYHSRKSSPSCGAGCENPIEHCDKSPSCAFYKRQTLGARIFFGGSDGRASALPAYSSVHRLLTPVRAAARRENLPAVVSSERLEANHG